MAPRKTSLFNRIAVGTAISIMALPVAQAATSTVQSISEKDKQEFDLSPKRCEIDHAKCRKCKACVKTGCPAITAGDLITINPDTCTGCSVCRQVCPFDAIEEVK